ncbi:hypothetical protein BDW68DRAFT_190877 [Aspergillus falconensis]
MPLLNLPLKVRYQIYELVFTDKVLAFTPGWGNPPLLHGICPLAGRKFHMLAGNSNDNTQWCDYVCRPLGILNPMLIVQISYFEVVRSIWSRSTIHIQMLARPRDFRMLSHLQRIISARSFYSIRRLEISFLHGSLYPWKQVLDAEWFAEWEGLWSLIGDMKSLVRIQAWIAMDQDQDGGEPGARLFKLLLALALDGIREFEVEVTWPPNEDSEKLLAQAPFRLTRNDEPIRDKPEMPSLAPDRPRKKGRPARR